MKRTTVRVKKTGEKKFFTEKRGAQEASAVKRQLSQQKHAGFEIKIQAQLTVFHCIRGFSSKTSDL